MFGDIREEGVESSEDEADMNSKPYLDKLLIDAGMDPAEFEADPNLYQAITASLLEEEVKKREDKKAKKRLEEETARKLKLEEERRLKKELEASVPGKPKRTKLQVTVGQCEDRFLYEVLRARLHDNSADLQEGLIFSPAVVAALQSIHESAE